jgi:hypothetical protein
MSNSRSIRGTVVRAGRITIDGETLDGIFVETTEAEIRKLRDLKLYNKPVFIQAERRRYPRSDDATIYDNLPPVKNTMKRIDRLEAMLTRLMET